MGDGVLLPCSMVYPPVMASSAVSPAGMDDDGYAVCITIIQNVVGEEKVQFLPKQGYDFGTFCFERTN